MRTIGLMVAPGDGWREVQVATGTTLADLIASQDLFGRSIIVDGQEVSPDQFSSITLNNVQEVWATGGVKGASV